MGLGFKIGAPRAIAAGRRLFLTATAALALLATSPPAAGAAERAPAAFRYTYAHRTCAPWDGSALAVVFQSVPVPAVAPGKLPSPHFPQYSLNLWTTSPPVQRWIAIPTIGATRMGNGAIVDCRAGQTCERRSGRVFLEELTPTLIRGELRITLPDGSGREMVLPFSAPILPYRAFCG